MSKKVEQREKKKISGGKEGEGREEEGGLIFWVGWKSKHLVEK